MKLEMTSGLLENWEGKMPKTWTLNHLDPKKTDLEVLDVEAKNALIFRERKCKELHTHHHSVVVACY